MSWMQVHTFGHAPSRQIMVRASPDEPYHALAPRSRAGLGPSPISQGGFQQLPALDPSPSKAVHYDKASGMWVADEAEADIQTEAGQEPHSLDACTAHPPAMAHNSPRQHQASPSSFGGVASDSADCLQACLHLV